MLHDLRGVSFFAANMLVLPVQSGLDLGVSTARCHRRFLLPFSILNNEQDPEDL